MVGEDKARRILIGIVYKCCDSLGYGTKCKTAFGVEYVVGNKRMTLSEYQDYCIKRVLRQFDIRSNV